MVLICDKQFTDDTYIEWFNEAASFPLSDFQKWAIKGIVDGDNVLVTAHTGSGKTLPAEFMIKYFTELADKNGTQRKRVIYASPIKALSNQKLYDFRAKFPNISIGLLTGDCKDNPEADVLIMTTEILRNTLFNKKIAQQYSTTIPLSFEMDIDNDLGGVIFDEVHYINDADRGSVWEQSILLLPPHVQLLMLSATINAPEQFASWIEDEKSVALENIGLPNKKMLLAPTYERVVPLRHYMWFDIHNSMTKKMKNKQLEQLFITNTQKLLPIKNENGYNATTYKNIKTMKDYLFDNNIRIHRKFVLNNMIKYLKNEGLLPAICFIFSRKQVEIAASEIEISLFEEDETYSSTVAQECKQLLISKFPNYREYIELPEYTSMIKLLEKGIAIHHAGVIPVIREMVELLFDKGYIRLLFATETFAVGINMPTKTVIFTSLEKFDGNGKRNLYPHEYTQMAGRAGRRGLDTQGVVIHCNNLFPLDTSSEYNNILCGKPQTIHSKFKISYSLLLSVMASGATNFNSVEQFVNQSMVKREINNDIKYIEKDIENISQQLRDKERGLTYLSVSTELIQEYINIENKIMYMKPKQQKIQKRRLNEIVSTSKSFKADLLLYKHINEFKNKINEQYDFLNNTNEYLKNEIMKVAGILTTTGFIEQHIEGEYNLTKSGNAASQFQEAQPLALSDLLCHTSYFKNYTASDIAVILSIFSNIRVSDENRMIKPASGKEFIDIDAEYYSKRIARYEELELSRQLMPIDTQEYNYDIMKFISRWCDDVVDENDCKQIIDELKEKDIFLGDFVKAILKINNVAAEIEKVAEMENNIELLEKLKEIPSLTLKYVATNQSLYL